MSEDEHFLSVEELTRLRKQALRRANILEDEYEGGPISREEAALCDIWIKKGGYSGGIREWSELVTKMKDSMLTPDRLKDRNRWKQVIRDNPKAICSSFCQNEFEDLPWLQELKQRGILDDATIGDRRLVNRLYPEERLCDLDKIAAEEQQATEELARIERDEGRRPISLVDFQGDSSDLK